MTARALRYLIDTLSLLWMSTAFRYAVGATATALVTVTILAPGGDEELVLSARQIEMQGKSSEQLIIANNSNLWREVRIALTPQSNGAATCDLHFAPIRASIPPGGTQVVRLLRTDTTRPCTIDHRLTISEAYAGKAPLFDVPVLTAQCLTADNQPTAC